jgi:hypothetical protein
MITIHNVYNVRGSNMLQLMRQTIREAQSRYDDHIILGDMNLYHPMWGGAHVKADNEADELIELIDELGLELLTEQGLIIW